MKEIEIEIPIMKEVSCGGGSGFGNQVFYESQKELKIVGIKKIKVNDMYKKFDKKSKCPLHNMVEGGCGNPPECTCNKIYKNLKFYFKK